MNDVRQQRRFCWRQIYRRVYGLVPNPHCYGEPGLVTPGHLGARQAEHVVEVQVFDRI